MPQKEPSYWLIKRTLEITGLVVLTITPTASFADHLEPKESEIRPGGDLFHTNLRRRELTKFNLRYADLRYADLTGCHPKEKQQEWCPANHISFADLRDAGLYFADLTGVYWYNTICPDETYSDDNGDTCENNL